MDDFVRTHLYKLCVMRLSRMICIGDYLVKDIPGTRMSPLGYIFGAVFFCLPCLGTRGFVSLLYDRGAR